MKRLTALEYPAWERSRPVREFVETIDGIARGVAVGLAVGTLVILGTLVARADDDISSFKTPPPQTFLTACQEAIPELPKLAARLGVKEFKPKNGTTAMVLGMCDGRQYSFVELLNALLDRMDKAVPR